MLAQELRLGNWVLDLHGNPVQITVIDGDIDWPKPIKLTPEILIKCGFENKIGQNRSYFYKDRFRVFLLRDASMTFSILGEKAKLKHLHSLQNLYYAVKKVEILVDWSAQAVEFPVTHRGVSSIWVKAITAAT